MNLIDWSLAPEGADFYSGGEFRRVVDPKSTAQIYTSEGWLSGGFTLANCQAMGDYQENPKKVKQTEELKKVETIESAEITQTKNKYDREIVGKYGTGKCVVDVYRVLDAFKTDDAAIDHAIKKLLCGGERGVKGQEQDWLEAIQSIQQAIALLNDKKSNESLE